jgi:DNA-binding PadR family transcriptional regulator
MFDRTKTKKLIFDTLLGWDFNVSKANGYNIAKKVGFSEAYIYKILRDLRSDGLIENSRGSWHLK